ANGTFHEFNDSIAGLGRIFYYDGLSMPNWHEKPFDQADGLSNKEIGIRDILARMPGLSREFSRTFGEPGKTMPISLEFQLTGSCKLRIDSPTLFTDQGHLIAVIQRLRTEYPFLEKWRFTEALQAWGNSIIFLTILN
ncbi:MAG: hypothetical protein JSS43_16430, partial [Proteobacteria bacterium]|nr:hypothetical protein [Pseudomonadota bacterium]